MKICDVCFNSEGDSRTAVNSIVFTETDETFDLCESHYQEIRELVNGRKRPSSVTYGLEAKSA